MASQTITHKIIGTDDWLIFSRASDGHLYYTIVETLPDWLDTPSRGDGEYGSPEWCADWRVIISRVINHPEHFSWELSDYGLGMSDDDFSQRTYARFYFH